MSKSGETTTTAAVVVAAGRGSRLALPEHGDVPKQYLTLGPRSMLGRTLTAFLAHDAIDRVIAVIGEGDRDAYASVVEELEGPCCAKLMPPTSGGATRQASVAAGLRALADNPPDRVLIHDAARPFVSPRLIDDVVATLNDHDGALPVLPIVDTVKRIDDGVVLRTEPRENLARAQTPQGFRFTSILAAHEAAVTGDRDALTDDAAVAEHAGLSVQVVDGDPENVKITTPEDYLEAAMRVAGPSPHLSIPWVPHVGFGYDVHAFEPGDAVTLCGVSIPHSHSLKGHSDADVAMHALTDALYGALAEGDIGTHFPPSDPQWKGSDSSLFLADAVGRVDARDGRIAHADITIICEQPKIGPHAANMRERLATLMAVESGIISVKATTSEQLGFTGRGEGIAAQASATVLFPDTGS